MQPMNQLTSSPLGLSTSQAAQVLGVSLGTIRRWSDMGYLESYRTPGGQRRFSSEQIETFLKSLQDPASSPRRVAANG
jgi:excisionase family DNA binding protein